MGTGSGKRRTVEKRDNMKKLNQTFYVQGGLGHSGEYPTLAQAKRAAQNAANETGRAVTVREDWDEPPKRIRVGGSYRMSNGKHVYRVPFMARPKSGAGRSNPTAANPSDSVLKGATVLGSVRNSRGQVTGLRVRLRPGAGGAGGTGRVGGAVKRTNPTGARKGKWYSAGKRAAKSGKYANKQDAWSMGRAKPTGAAGAAAQAAFFDGWRDAGYRTNPPILKLPLHAMKHENERERYPNGVSISAKRISGRSYGYTVHYDGWRTKLFTAPGAARKFAESQSKK
jgi:hypothetical protein